MTFLSFIHFKKINYDALSCFFLTHNPADMLAQHIQRPFSLIEEDARSRVGSPVARVEEMFKQIKAKLPGPPEFILCVLPEKKNSDIYGLFFKSITFYKFLLLSCIYLLLCHLLGPWKKKCLSDFGIVTQCISPNPSKINDHYLTNVLLKINAKVQKIKDCDCFLFIFLIHT